MTSFHWLHVQKDWLAEIVKRSLKKHLTLQVFGLEVPLCSAFTLDMKLGGYWDQTACCQVPLNGFMCCIYVVISRWFLILAYRHSRLVYVKCGFRALMYLCFPTSLSCESRWPGLLGTFSRNNTTRPRDAIKGTLHWFHTWWLVMRSSEKITLIL